MGGAVVNNLGDGVNRDAANHLLGETIAKLCTCTQIDTIGDWQSCEANFPPSQINRLYSLPWVKLPINSKNQITWAGGAQVLWLQQKIIIPKTLYHYPLEGLSLRLALTWWAEVAQVFVDGQLAQEGDLFDAQARVLLREAAVPGDEVEVLLRLVSPSHDRGALMRSRCIYELPYSTFQSSPKSQLWDLNFVADQLVVYQQYLAEEDLWKLANITAEIPWSLLPEPEKFNLSLTSWYQSLVALGLPQAIQERQIHLLGHAHLDMAWLWEVAETWQAAQRTFASVINLQEDFPELIFCHSTPALYQWIEHHRPDLFAIIHTKVQQGTWELVGGMWVEPEMNLINGESIARQLLYGQNYLQEKFGQIAKIAWLPDTFGFCATLPQCLQLAGIDYFVTQKLDWNDTTKFPYPLFWWESADGSRVLSLMSNPIGEGIEPGKIATYAANWESKTGIDTCLWLLGVGDHGGGPSRDMLETIKRWQLDSGKIQESDKSREFDKLNKIPSAGSQTLGSETELNLPQQYLAFPQLKFTTALDYLEQRKSSAIASQLPVWHEELYLEFHRGCYTTHADQKYFNRYCEGLLYELELLAAIATLTTGKAYPQAEITRLWQKVLFNQFHDILPGTSIPEVFITANQDWLEVIHLGEKIYTDSWQAIFSQINCSPPPPIDPKNVQPIFVFNSLNWQRSEVVSIKLPENISHNSLDNSSKNNLQRLWQVLDIDGQIIPSQLSTSNPDVLLFLAKDIPSIGFSCFWLQSSYLEPEKQEELRAKWLLENGFLRIFVDPITGNLASVFDLVNSREILQETGEDQIQFWQDSGQYWDAWNIDPEYAQYPLPAPELISINYLETGAVRQSIRVVRKFRESTFIQDYILDINSPLIKIATTVDWQESHVLVKAVFPLNITSDVATYEIPWGTIDRPTLPTTTAEKAKWEVPALRWADLSNRNYGVSLLNDCKYGYDAQPDQLRLTLLRGSEWPDCYADHHQHQFTYALYPHAGNHQQAKTQCWSYEMNLPLKANFVPSQQDRAIPLSPPRHYHSWLRLNTSNLIITSLKQAESSPEQWILRCYETDGKAVTALLYNSLELAITHTVNLLETEIPPKEHRKLEKNSFVVSPHQIISLCLE